MKSFSQTLLYLIVINTSVLSLRAQIPVLNSYPEAAAVIYLDFDGEFVAGTGWNWMGNIDAAPATTPAASIVETFNRVAEDFRPFNINITTDLNVFLAAPANRRMRVILTPTYSWYGHAGGVAFVNSFIWGDDTPCFVFSSLLGDDPKFLAEAISHEAGHTLGLQHQSEYDSFCTKVQEYYGGRGEGQIGWAPIMGVGYYKNFTTWNVGPNTASCNRIQNDIAVIAGKVGLRSDDHAASPDSATLVPLVGVNFNVSGLINQSGDQDVFQLDIPLTSNLLLSAVPENVGAANEGANIDLLISILNDTQDTIGSYNPYDLLDAGIDTSLSQGTYYIVVSGVGNINHSDYGSIGHYALNGALLQVLPLRRFVLQGRQDNGSHMLTWTYQSTGSVKEILVESSEDGIYFKRLASLEGSSMKFTYRPVTPSVYYRIKAVMEAGEGMYSSNVFLLKGGGTGRVHLTSRIVRDLLTVHCSEPNDYALFDGTGRLLDKGRFVKGMNQLAIRHAPSGLLTLQLNDGTRILSEKLIKQ